MSYLLNSDKSENFECKLCLEGASLDDSEARVVINANGLNLLYEGTISGDGECNIQIEGLKKIFPKEVSGNMRLEVIADDTYFCPWQEQVTIKPSKSLTIEQVKTPPIPSKPAMKVEVKAKPIPQQPTPRPNISKLCEFIKAEGLTKEVIYKNKQKSIPVLGKVIREYYKSVGATPRKGIVKEILNKL